MIRRDIAQLERDQKTVRWALVAAVLALSAGAYAETRVPREPVESAVAAGQVVEVEDDKPTGIQG